MTQRTPPSLVPTGLQPVSRRILVVEDSPLNQMLVTALLAQAGHRADTANNGLEAVMAAQAGGYDLILMDLSMPEMDGLPPRGCCAACRGRPAGCRWSP